MLAVEIMDTAFMNSISKWKKWDEMLASPWFTVYPGRRQPQRLGQ